MKDAKKMKITSESSDDLAEESGEDLTTIKSHNPLFESKKAFAELGVPPEMVEILREKGFVTPSLIQETALPLALCSNKEDNLVVQSQSGTGKTLCFIIPMLLSVDVGETFPQVVCLAHTTDLVIQIHRLCLSLGEKMGINVALVKAGMNSMNGRAQIIVATPPKLEDMVKRKKADISQVKLFVMDEADELLDVNKSLGLAAGKIRLNIRKDAKTYLFSATFHEERLSSIDRFLCKARKTERALLHPNQLPLSTLHQFSIRCDGPASKFALVEEMFRKIPVGKTVMFMNTRRGAREIKDALEGKGHKVSLILGNKDMLSEEREEQAKLFSDGPNRALIATNVWARGIDDRKVHTVINFDMPYVYSGGEETTRADVDTYIHRIGRCARFGARGISINLLESRKDNDAQKEIEEYYQVSIKDASGGMDVIEEIFED
jgi:ATP-dependent RNA helicase DDX19/DBP5